MTSVLSARLQHNTIEQGLRWWGKLLIKAFVRSSAVVSYHQSKAGDSTFLFLHKMRIVEPAGDSTGALLNVCPSKHSHAN